MAKGKVEFACTACGFSSPKWLGRCPDCGQWGSIVEEVAAGGTKYRVALEGVPVSKPVPLDERGRLVARPSARRVASHFGA